MKIKTLSDNFLSIQFYQRPRLSKSIWVLLFILPFFFGLLFNFPLKSKISALAKSQIEHLPCQLSYDSLEFEYFLPKIVMTNPLIPRTCWGSGGGKDLDLSFLHLKFRGPSLWPLGAKSLITTEFKGSEINLYHILSYNREVYKLDDTELNLKEVTQQMGLPALDGHLQMTSLLDLHQTEGLKSLHLLLKSKDFKIQPQNIQGFQLPLLPIGNFQVKATSEEKNKVQISEIIVGDEKSPIIARFSGSLSYSQEDPMASALNLSGEVKFSEAFIKEFAILNLFLQKYRQKDGLYQVKVQGSLDSPRFSPL